MKSDQDPLRRQATDQAGDGPDSLAWVLCRFMHRRRMCTSELATYLGVTRWGLLYLTRCQVPQSLAELSTFCLRRGIRYRRLAEVLHVGQAHPSPLVH